MQAANAGVKPRAPPTDQERKLMDVLLQASESRFVPLLACIKGWSLEAQADLANWRPVLVKLHNLLLGALQMCPHLLFVKTEVKTTDQPIAMQTEQELIELVCEVLKFSGFLLENSSNKAVYPSAEPVMALLAARNERIICEATKVAAMLATPPQIHRHTTDPTSFVDPAAGKNTLLRRRLLTIAQGRGAPKNSLEVVDYLHAAGADAPKDIDFQFYSSDHETNDLKSRVVSVVIPPYEEAATAMSSTTEVACVAATTCERLIDLYKIPLRLHFQLYTQVRGIYASRSALSRENMVIERLNALLALFSLYSDAWDVTNYVEQHQELTRGIVELVRVENIQQVPVRVRVVALHVLTALVNDRAGRAGGIGMLGRQSNVLQALGVVKGTPHGAFPSLVRYCTAELGDVTSLSVSAPSLGPLPPPPIATESTDMDMSLAVAFVQATTDSLSPQEAQVIFAPPFRSDSYGSTLETKLCWIEAVLELLTALVAIQSGAAVLTENGIVPALLHAITIPALDSFHMAVTTQCVQALEITVSSHSAAAALYRDLNGVGILVDRLKFECVTIAGIKESAIKSQSAISDTKIVLLLAILASLSVSFHSQSVMSAGATSRAIRDGSALNKVLYLLLSSVDIFGPVIFAQAAIVVSDIINNDPSSINHVHASGLAEAFLKTLTRWDIAELYPARMLLPPSSELLTAVPTVLNSLCLTTAHAEKVFKFEPLMHLLDIFALPQFTEDDCKDYCFHSDTAAVVGTGIFELMRHVPSFQNAAIQAVIHALKKIIRFGEESYSSTIPTLSQSVGDKVDGILVRMTTHVADLLEPLLTKPEYAAYFADLGGIQLLLALYQIMLPSTSSFLKSALPIKTTTSGLHTKSLAHKPAVQSITLALRSYAIQQPTNLLEAITKELGVQLDNLQRSRSKIGMPWILSESGEGAEKVLSSLPDFNLADLLCNHNRSCSSNPIAEKVITVGKYLRVLAVLEWLTSVLISTLEVAHTHMQSWRWFADFTASPTQQILTRLFCVDRSVQFERASLAALHQKKQNIESSKAELGGKVDVNVSSSAMDESKPGAMRNSNHRGGLWKMGSLLLLRFSLTMRGLLSAHSKVLLSAPLQHRRGDDVIVPLAPHAKALARAAAQIIKGHLYYITSATRATQIDTFVRQYYLTFVLETISSVLFEGKKKQANTLLLLELMKPISEICDVQVCTRAHPIFGNDIAIVDDDVSDAVMTAKTIANGAVAQISVSNLMEVVMNIIQQLLCACLAEEISLSSVSTEIKASQMALTSFHIAASALRKLSNLELLSTSPLTAALLRGDEAIESGTEPFEPEKLKLQLHAMCVRALLSIWKSPTFASLSADLCLFEIMPIAVTILKNRVNSVTEVVESEGVARNEHKDELRRGSRERNFSTDFHDESLSLQRSLMDGNNNGELLGTGGNICRQPLISDPEIIDNLISMGFLRSRVERALQEIQANNVVLAMEWILSHPVDESRGEDVTLQPDKTSKVDNADALCHEMKAAEKNKMDDQLQALYALLRNSFEAVCFQILRVQSRREVNLCLNRNVESVGSETVLFNQNLVKTIAEYFNFLCSQSESDCELVMRHLNRTILHYFDGAKEEGGDNYLAVLTHLLALVLRLHPNSWDVMQRQSPLCIDKLVDFISSMENGNLMPSFTPVVLVLDAVVAGKAAMQNSIMRSPSYLCNKASDGNKEINSTSNFEKNHDEGTVFERHLVNICLNMLRQRSFASSANESNATAHAVWQLLSRLTLKYDLASYFSAHGGLDAILDIPDDWFFVGYQELTCALLSQALESPEVLEHSMEDKIRRAVAKLSTRFGSPNQMRITPRALLTEVAPFAARNETVFLRALRNAVRVKKTESSRAYIVPRPADRTDTIPEQLEEQPFLNRESAARGTKALHKLPKDHKQQAHVIVNKIVGRIRRLWAVEKHTKKQFDVQDTVGSASARMCVGVYMQLLVHLITHFPACATVLAKAKDETDSRDSFIYLVLREFLPSSGLCQFAKTRKKLKEEGYYGIGRFDSSDTDLLVADIKSYIDNCTRMRVHNAHRLLVSVGGHSGEGSKCIISELVHLLQDWPQSCVADSSIQNVDLSVRDEIALSSLHAWSGLIMSVLWPKGSSKGFAWDKVVLERGIKGKNLFVTLLAEALRKIDLTHPLAHATCTMLLRPLSTLTRSFVTHRMKRMLKKRNDSAISGNAGVVEVHSASNAGEGLLTVTGAPTILREPSTSTAGNSMAVNIETSEADNSAESNFYPLRDDEDDDVSMRSPLSADSDHDMQDDDEEHSEDDGSDRSSVSGQSTDEGEGEDEGDDDNDDDDEEDEDDDGGDEGEFEAHNHLHLSRRASLHGRRATSNRLWGSIESELSILDALDEVDEEEFSYPFILDDEAYFAEEQQRRLSLAAARNPRPGDEARFTRNNEDRLVESMRDALGSLNTSGDIESRNFSNQHTLLLTFGDFQESEEREGESLSDFATIENSMGREGLSVSEVQTPLTAGRMANSLLQYIEELPEMLDDDFLFESFDTSGRNDRSHRERQLVRPDPYAVNTTMHPMLRVNGRADAFLLESNGQLRNASRLPVSRHSSLLRELQDLTDQVQIQPTVVGSRSRLALGRDMLQRSSGRSRGRTPSRVNRLSAVSNLLSDFSLDIPSSTLPSRNQRYNLRRGEQDMFRDAFVGVDLTRSHTSRSGIVIGGNGSSPAIWGPSALGQDVDVRSVASRLEQQLMRICADDEPTVTPASGQGQTEASFQDIDDIMEECSTTRTLQSEQVVLSNTEAANVVEESHLQLNIPTSTNRTDSIEATADAASVLELTSSLGETSLLRSPPASDVEVDLADVGFVSIGNEVSLASPQAITSEQGSNIESTASSAPSSFVSAVTTATPSDAMLNFTLDLSAFRASATAISPAGGMPPSVEVPLTDTHSSSAEAAQSQLHFSQREEQSHYRCPEGMDAEVFASLPSDMQAEIVAQSAPEIHESASALSGAATAEASGPISESMSQMDLDMANSTFDRETLEALPPDIRAEVLENERHEREAAARAETADTSLAQEMDNASFVASLAPELREEILITCDEAFLHTLSSQVRAEAMVLRERAAFRTATYRDRSRGPEGRASGGGEAEMDNLLNRPSLRRMLTSLSPERESSSRRRSRFYYDELGGGRRSNRRDYRQESDGSKTRKGFLRVAKDEEETLSERIFDDRCVRGLLRLLFMTESVIQNRVFQRLLANMCLYPLTRRSIRRNMLQLISLPLSQPLTPADEKDNDDDGSGKIQFPPSRMFGCGIDGNRVITGSAVPAEVVNRMLHVLVTLAKYNLRFAVELLEPHGMRHTPNEENQPVKVELNTSEECGAAVLIDMLSLPVVFRNDTNLDALLELLELVFSPLERLHQQSDEEEGKREMEEGDASAMVSGDECVKVPAVMLNETRMGDIVSVLSMDLCTAQMQERTLAVLKLLNYVTGNRELGIHAIISHASTLAHIDQYKDRKLSAGSTTYESSAVLPSAQDELKLLRLLHSLSDVCESTVEFAECCQTIGLDSLWNALSLSLTEARAKGGIDDPDNVSASDGTINASFTSSAAGLEHQTPAIEDVENTVIEGTSAGASCAMAALLARFLPLVEAFFVVNARDAASMSLRVPDLSEREETMVAALRLGGFEGAGATALKDEKEQKSPTKNLLNRNMSSISSFSEASETKRLASFVESNRILLNLLVREKPLLLDTSLAALIKLSRCRAYLAFDNKRTYFHSYMKRLRQAALRNHGGGSSSVRIPVRRDHIFEDSYYALRMRSGSELRRKLHISFTGEEGIDAGGVTREWYMILAREMFNPNYVLFTSAADSPTFQPNPLSYVNKDHLSYFEFVGKVLGKAVADGQLLDAHFTRSFYKHILQLPITYHDMEAIDPEYYRNLHSILDNSIVDLGLDLTFSAEQSNFGKVEIVDLIPNGQNVPVTDDNKMEYVKLVTHHRMATGIRQQIDAFLKGFHQLVPPELIAIFNENELELLISGMPEIDIDDLKANTEYANYKPTDSVIRWFWNVLYAFTHEERALFLQFVTGTSKVPLEGFKALEGMRGTQKFNIHKAFGNISALPSAHTCFNQLDLPEYESEEKLKQCLLLAVREGSEGFGFG
ncbi:hypothetical protein CCR75_003872 [Bremia lactucae]|uniref:HECT-type E3 ubiquitin transferase n=1 Tax=Bremia lactucae TaxID=4779 RepID=A0A976IHU4_BRELC|nr:hypothetical protein CCR75_003872 [Bremia lactucae]